MFPLKQRKLIRGAAAHIAAGLGAGADYVAAAGTPLYAPFDGTISTSWGNQGGNWSKLTRPNGDRIEMAHLDSFLVKTGTVSSGHQIAYTGNTGAITTGPHLHVQIFRDGKRLDPERYNWEESVIIEPMDKLSDHIVDGMPADQRIAALKAQVKRYGDIINSPTDGIAALTAQIKERDEILDEKRAEIIALKVQLGTGGITAEQQAGLDLLARVKAVFKELG